MTTDRDEPRSHVVVFSAVIAACMVGLRMLLFESCMLDGACVPNHDMSQGFAFFATSLQSLRLTGEIAWWNPIALSGYAQYYQSFLSPLAPTPHHVTFIVWSYVVRLLAWVHVGNVSEYRQYVWFNYLLLPFLTYWALGGLAARLFRHRVAIVLVLLTYALSSIGVWNAAWFYFQEPFTLFFLLAAAIAAAQRPAAGRIAVLAAAVLVQVSSINYWSLYNALFVLIVLGTFACFHAASVGRLARAGFALLRESRWALLGTLLAVATCAVWLVLIASVAKEQEGVYERANTSESAAERVKPLRTFTAELFNPDVDIAIENYPVRNKWELEPDVHNARYIGVALLPWLVLAPFALRRRRDAWLATVAVCLFVVCLAPPFLAVPLEAVPFLNSIQHLFYFYTAYWQLSLLLLAAATLDTVLDGPHERRRQWLAIAGIFGAVVVLAAACSPLFSSRLPGYDAHFSSYVSGVAVCLASTALLVLMVAVRSSFARLTAGVLLLVCVGVDLGRYFAHVSAIDQAFTLRYWKVPSPITPDYRDRLFAGLGDPDPTQGFAAGLAARFPLNNRFWPRNRYLIPRALPQVRKVPAIGMQVEASPAIDFFPGSAVTPAPGTLIMRRGAGARDVLDWQWTRWTYNEFAFRFAAAAPGWLFVRELYDPSWQFSIDDVERDAQPANYVGTGLQVDAGSHRMRMTYRPLARALYGPGCVLLVGSLSFLMCCWAAETSRRRSST